MDSRYRAWKLRNSTEIWRPNPHVSNNAKAHGGRLSASDSDCKFPAMMRHNEKSLQAKWDSSTSSGAFTQESTSSTSVGSKSSSPILRCRTVSPDLSRTLAAHAVNISESTAQAQGKGSIFTNPEISVVAEHVASASAEPTSSAAVVDSLTLYTVGDLAAIERPESRVVKHQQRRRNRASSLSALAAQKEVVGRPASVSPQMWQEKVPVTKNRTDRSIVACKRWQSPQGAVAFGTRTPKKKDNEAKNKCFPQSLDVFFVPGVPLPTFTRLQRSIVGKRESSFPVDQMLLPLRGDLDELQNELVLCSTGAFLNNNSFRRDDSPPVGGQTSENDQDALTLSLRSPEQCVLMRINMAFEPGAKPSVPCKSTQPNLVLVEPDDEELATRCSYDLEAKGAIFQSHPGETSKEEEVESEERTTERWCDAHEENLFSTCVLTDEDLEVTEGQMSPRRRRWPKAPPSISDRGQVERLSTTSTLSWSEKPKPEMNSEENFISVSNDAFLKTDKVRSEIASADSFKVGTGLSSQDDDFQESSDLCPVRAAVQDTETSRDLLSLGGPSTSDTNSKTRGFHIRGEHFFEKRAGRSPGKRKDEVSLASSSKSASDPNGVFYSLKSKRALERATLYKIDKKRKDDSSQCSVKGKTEAKRTGSKDKISMRAEPISSLKGLKEREMKREEGPSSPQKSLMTRKMSISGPPDAFREISIDHSFRALNLKGIESLSEGEVRDVRRSCNGGHHLHGAQSSTQGRDSTYTVQLPGLPGQEPDFSNLVDLATSGNLIEQSCRRTNDLNRLGDYQETNSSSSGICMNTQAGDTSEVVLRTEEKSISDGISRMWSILHHDTESTDRASLSSEKFSSILSYLGHVEESNLQENFKLLHKRDLAQEGTSFSFKGSHSPCTVLEHEDSVSLANSTYTSSVTHMSNQSGEGEVGFRPATSLFEGVRKKMQEFKAKIASKESQNAELLREMEELKADKDQALLLERGRFGRELEVRAAEYKAAIQHHLALNEKMVKDKEALSEKCCNLAGILSSVELKFEDKVKALKEQFAQDLKKQKEIWIAGEKPKREAWKEKKIKEIKELTIKGLEPHIESLNEKHKQDIRRLETRYADETQKKLDVQSIHHREEICVLRNRFLKERDENLEKERMAALTRINDVAEKYEQQAMELRRKVSSDMAAELEKVEEARRKDKQMAHEMLSKAREESNDREAALKKSLEKAMQDAAAEKDTMIQALQSELERFKNDWEKELDEKLRENMQIQVDEYKSRCTKERDEQIEMIIERIENEKDEAIAQHQQELLAKVEILMEEKLESVKKLKEVESKCANLCKISLEAKQKAEMESVNKDMQVESLRRKMLCQADLIEQHKSQIQQEKRNLTEQEQRFEARLAEERELLRSAQLDVERFSAETQQLRFRKAKELEEVEIHVRQAIDNKDQVIAGLREQLLAAREQIQHTELLLQQEHIAFTADPD